MWKVFADHNVLTLPSTEGLVVHRRPNLRSAWLLPACHGLTGSLTVIGIATAFTVPGVLFEGGWRERKTAAWLVAVARRSEFRELIGRLLLASEGPYAGAAYCVVLAKFGTAADAELLSAYLDHYLSHPDLDYDQAVVLGELLYLDEMLGSKYTTRFLAPAGPWGRWLEVRAVAALAPHDCRQAVQQLCTFVDETAEVFASLDCGS
ncbi:DUF6000 family protein [Streptomyces sp. NPDC059766]|uniref:DUF6000 family protein n=1 Tax=Streptomyces sp. NPDC059766 TaxID=3346940 RepID=UPI003649DAB8